MAVVVKVHVGQYRYWILQTISLYGTRFWLSTNCEVCHMPYCATLGRIPMNPGIRSLNLYFYFGRRDRTLKETFEKLRQTATTSLFINVMNLNLFINVIAEILPCAL